MDNEREIKEVLRMCSDGGGVVDQKNSEIPYDSYTYNTRLLFKTMIWIIIVLGVVLGFVAGNMALYIGNDTVTIMKAMETPVLYRDDVVNNWRACILASCSVWMITFVVALKLHSKRLLLEMVANIRANMNNR